MQTGLGIVLVGGVLLGGAAWAAVGEQGGRDGDGVLDRAEFSALEGER